MWAPHFPGQEYRVGGQALTSCSFRALGWLPSPRRSAGRWIPWPSWCSTRLMLGSTCGTRTPSCKRTPALQRRVSGCTDLVLHCQRSSVTGSHREPQGAPSAAGVCSDVKGLGATSTQPHTLKELLPKRGAAPQAPDLPLLSNKACSFF